MTESTIAPPVPRKAGVLLIAASVSFLLVIASMIASVAAAGWPTEEPITHDLLDPIAFWRAALGWTLVVPISLAAVGSILLVRSARTEVPRLVTVTIDVWVLAVAATLAYAIAWQISLGFTTPTVLDDPARSVALLIFSRFAIPLAALGSVGTALCLRAIGGGRRALLAVVVIGAVIAIAFAAGAHEVAPLPPAVLVGLWIPLAVSALRRATRSGRQSTLLISATT
ncbi:hypothetical protein BH10ACT7_BH10ACT7_25540 [soil metagenome]